jgi:hypothetical protein
VIIIHVFNANLIIDYNQMDVIVMLLIAVFLIVLILHLVIHRNVQGVDVDIMSHSPLKQIAYHVLVSLIVPLVFRLYNVLYAILHILEIL